MLANVVKPARSNWPGKQLWWRQILLYLQRFVTASSPLGWVKPSVCLGLGSPVYAVTVGLRQGLSSLLLTVQQGQ